MTLLGVRNYGRRLLCWRHAWLLCWLVLCDSWAALSMVPGAWSVCRAYWRSLVFPVFCVSWWCQVLGDFSVQHDPNDVPEISQRCRSYRGHSVELIACIFRQATIDRCKHWISACTCANGYTSCHHDSLQEHDAANSFQQNENVKPPRAKTDQHTP